jgi:hypothetical protein
MRRYVQGLVLLAIFAAVVGVSCRRNQPSLVDRNQAPDTQLWYAPPDSTDYEYLVHMYWRGLDGDGLTTRYIWSIQDTIIVGEAAWNPAESISDYRRGRITTRTDSVFAFTAYKNVAGVGVRKNRQAFFVASIDDNGVIDPSPASVEFVATIGELPVMRFVVYPDGNTPHAYANRTPPADTVGMFKPFAISYHGLTTNGRLEGYQFFPLSTTILIPGQNEWTEDLTDTLRTFANTGTDALPAGVFKFAAQCIDDANAESQVDAGQFTRGVAQVVVNFDPDTWITYVSNTYIKSATAITQVVNFADAVPDTVPFKSWTYYQYNSVDDTRDTWICSLTVPDKCIDFQVKYKISTSTGSSEDSGWLPRNGKHDSDGNSAQDSNSVSIGSLDYQWFVRGIDEHGTVDGTPPSFHVVGNFQPKIDTTNMVDQFGTALNLAVLDTMTWDFNNPASYDSGQGGYNFQKTWSWTINATGHDHPKDPDNSSVLAWRYYVFTDYVPGAGNDPGTGTAWQLGRSGDSWFASVSTNTMSDLRLLVLTTIRGDDQRASAGLLGSGDHHRPVRARLAPHRRRRLSAEGVLGRGPPQPGRGYRDEHSERHQYVPGFVQRPPHGQEGLELLFEVRALGVAR